MAKKKDLVSALVIFRPKSGAKMDRNVPITSENVAEFAPDPARVAEVQEVLKKLGFDVSMLTGISVSITAPPEVFKNAFGAEVAYSAKSGAQFVDEDGKQFRELSHKRLPKSISEPLEAISFSPPPDFGPTNP